MEEGDLWPARNVAEYAYCPRLFYLMQVEGVFLPSADTEQGAAVHRRTDLPSEGRPEEATDPNRPVALRSLTLTSEGLGLTATLDLAEVSGATAVPVEYRKGRPCWPHPSDGPDNASPPDDESTLTTPQPWPTDRVQVGLQALLLREAGYTVDRAVLYYGAEKLRLEIPVDDVLLGEALATLDAAKTCAQGPRPLPLVNDPKCVGCSLQPFCLPDEINYQREMIAGQPVRRSLWPPRDEGLHLVAQRQASRVGVRGHMLLVTDRDGEVLDEIPIANVDSLAILGYVQLTTQALHTLAEHGIPVAFLSSAGRLVTFVDPLDSVSANVRRAQVRRLDDPTTCLELARALVAAKIANQRTLLMRNHPALPDVVLADLAREAKRASEAESLDTIRGHEGAAAALYFQHFPDMFPEPVASQFREHGRQRRPPPDPVNACLSMSYSMLTHECVSALRLASLEPSIGAFHSSRPGRPALALDLMEPFRPLIGDSLTLIAFNRGELAEGHFHQTAAGCLLTPPGRRAFFSVYGRRMDTEITHPLFKYRLSYRRMIMLHARMISAWLLGEIPELAFLTTR